MSDEWSSNPFAYSPVSGPIMAFAGEEEESLETGICNVCAAETTDDGETPLMIGAGCGICGQGNGVNHDDVEELAVPVDAG